MQTLNKLSFNLWFIAVDGGASVLFREGPSILGWSEETEKSEELVKVTSRIQDNVAF